MGDAEGTSGRLLANSPAPTEEPAGTPVNPTVGTEGSRGATSTKFPDVRYSQPGRYNPKSEVTLGYWVATQCLN